MSTTAPTPPATSWTPQDLPTRAIARADAPWADSWLTADDQRAQRP